MWALLHHRLFLERMDAAKVQKLSSGLRIMLECQDVLQEFEALEDANIVGFGFARKMWHAMDIPCADDDIFLPSAQRLKTEAPKTDE